MSAKQQNMESEKAQLQRDLENQDSEAPQAPAQRFLILWLTFVLACMGTIITSNWKNPNAPIHASHPLHKPLHPLVNSTISLSSATTSACEPLSIRREWRSLAREEQRHYITSIRCLIDQPSVFNTGSRYSDFLTAYTREGWHSNPTSSYLPWNRWFLHTLETALRTECGYTGDMAYLDPSQDRDFLPMGSKHESQASLVDAHSKLESPRSKLNTMLEAPTYDIFALMLEHESPSLTPLDASSPDLSDDPLFLHQTQIDHLWWQWQSENPHAETPEWMEDQVVRLEGLSAPTSTKTVFETENGELCYRY